MQVGRPTEIYARPTSRFVAEFMGEVNVFEIGPGGALSGVEAVAPGATEGGYLILRPEKLRVLGEGETAEIAFAATVENDYVLGSRSQFHLRAGERTLITELPAAAAARIAVGETVRLGFDRADAVETAE
jgi:spermidine/putrescine transport system ATP-binding protein